MSSIETAGIPEETRGESGSAGAVEGTVNFDEAALVELELDGTDYRLDSGRAGTALCISTRPSGTWSWTFRGEARWQANVLRCKVFDRSVLTQLAQALAEVSSGSD
ncbi:MAG: hypothetical protein ABI895_21315 [Deltaproteobacteria bacterium]